jgi:hypothetical protein
MQDLFELLNALEKSLTLKMTTARLAESTVSIPRDRVWNVGS